MAVFHSLGKHADLGLLVIRLGVGAMFLVHGVPKLAGGPAGWESLGRTMGNLGIHFAPTFWGLMAGLAEALGGLLLMVGFFTRPACMVMAFTMFVAMVSHLSNGDPIGRTSHAIEALCLFLGLILVGPGRHSIDKR